MEMYYCTLDDARSEMAATSLTITNDQVMRSVAQVSRRIDGLMGGRSMLPFFGPVIEARTIPINENSINSRRNTLQLVGGSPLLALTVATVDGTVVTSSAEGYPHGAPYFRQVRINSNGNRWYSYISSCDYPDAVITGIWGYHSDYAHAWRDTGYTLSALITAGATSFTVSNIDGPDPYGFEPAFSRGQLVRFGTGTDYAIITDTNINTNVATIVRNVLGSTGVEQAQGAAIYTWQVEEPIRRVTARQAAFLLARRGGFESSTFDGVGTVQYPSDLLGELADIVRDYMNA